MHPKVSLQLLVYTGAGYGEFRACVCLHACNSGYTCSSVCTYIGVRVHVSIYIFLFLHSQNYLIPHCSGQGFRTWYGYTGSALQNPKGSITQTSV